MFNVNSFPNIADRLFSISSGGALSGLKQMEYGITANISLNLNISDSASFSPDIADSFTKNPLFSSLQNSGLMTPGMGMIPGFGGACCPSGSMFGSRMRQETQIMLQMMMILFQMMSLLQRQTIASSGSGFSPAVSGGAGAAPASGIGSSGTGSPASMPAYSSSLPSPVGSSGTASAGRVPVDKYGSFEGRPHGLNEIKKMFGEPGQNQVTVEMPAGKDGKMIKVTCHKLIADRMKAAFEEIKARGLSHCIDSFDGCYNNRSKRGGSAKSVHAWGIGFDVNASSNPMGKNTQTPEQKQLAQIFAKYGFYQLPNDPMHFQFCTGY